MSPFARRVQRASIHTPAPTETIYSLWPNNPTPSEVSVNDSAPVALGLKFSSSITTNVLGVRFYKGSTNTGTHTGSLWTTSGTILGSKTFSNETASGWQSVYFDSPVAISANTTYVVSYHTPTGYYSADSGFFSAGGITSGILTGISNTLSANGLYAYGDSTVFPDQSFNATNYWVDVLVAGPLDVTPPSQPSITSANITGKLVALSWTTSTDAYGISEYKVYRDGIVLATTTGTTFTDTTAQPVTSYTYTVRAFDNAGNASQESAGYTLTTDPNIPPIASFISHTTGLLLYVDANGSSDTDGTIVSYEWDFGDTGTDSGAYADHVYSVDGTYTITLTVTDDTGQTSSTSQTVTALSSNFIANVINTPSQAGYPDETNTGVPTGTVLESFSGAYYIQTDNTVVDSMDIYGIIVVQANNVTIRNTRITTGDYFPIRRDNGVGFLIEDSEIIGLSTDTACALGFEGYTARRLNVHGTADGFKANSNVVIEDCFIHDLAIGNDTHNDGVQTTSGANVVIRHNTLRLGDQAGSNACIQFGNEDGINNNWLVKDNLFDGGGWTLNGSGDPLANTNITIIGNRFTHRYEYGIGGVGGANWAGNYFDNDGALA